MNLNDLVFSNTSFDISSELDEATATLDNLELSDTASDISVETSSSSSSGSTSISTSDTESVTSLGSGSGVGSDSRSGKSSIEHLEETQERVSNVALDAMSDISSDIMSDATSDIDLGKNENEELERRPLKITGIDRRLAEAAIEIQRGSSGWAHAKNENEDVKPEIGQESTQTQEASEKPRELEKSEEASSRFFARGDTSSSEESEEDVRTKKRAPIKKAAIKKRKQVFEDKAQISEEQEEDVRVKKRAPIKKEAIKRRKQVSEDKVQILETKSRLLQKTSEKRARRIEKILEKRAQKARKAEKRASTKRSSRNISAKRMTSSEKRLAVAKIKKLRKKADFSEFSPLSNKGRGRMRGGEEIGRESVRTPTRVSFSQRSISQATREGLSLEELIFSINKGWKKGEKLSLVEFESEGKFSYVSLDNRRLYALKNNGQVDHYRFPVTIYPSELCCSKKFNKGFVFGETKKNVLEHLKKAVKTEDGTPFITEEELKDSKLMNSIYQNFVKNLTVAHCLFLRTDSRVQKEEDVSSPVELVLFQGNSDSEGTSVTFPTWNKVMQYKKTIIRDSVSSDQLGDNSLETESHPEHKVLPENSKK